MRRALSVLLALALLVGAVSPVAAQTDGDDSSESQDVGEDLTEGLGPETLGPEASLEPDSGTQWTADAVVYPNLGSQLSAVAVAFDEDDPNSPLSGEAMRSSVGTEPNSVGAEPLLLTIQTDGNADGVVDFLASNGVSAANVVGDYLEAYVPPDLLAGLAAETGVERVREMPEPFKTKGSVKSAGVAVHGASVWHRNGFTGDGVKVGVIDTGTTATAKDGFTGLRALRGTELPSTVTGRCYIDVGRPSSDLANCDAPGGDNHGTLVAETLMDMVPDADLYVSNPRTWADLHSAVVWMHGQGVKVIVYAVSWNWHGPADGTSPVNPSPINTAKWAADNGIIWVNSAGNYGRMSWLGSFADTDNDGYHQWSSGGAEAQTFYLRAGAYMFIALRWDDTWGGATKDLDLQVRYSATRGGTQSVVGSSADTQNGRATDYPYEGARVKVLSGGDGYYSFYVKKKGSSVAPTWVQVLIFTDAVPHLPYYTAGGSIGSPADSSHAGVLAVGAASYSSTNVIRNYSSRGPTPDNRTKPDIVGVDCTRTVSKSSGFCGTSQSAPHVGGLAALVIDRNPSFTAQQVANYLKTNAEERGAPGADNTWGHGFAILPITGLIPDDGCAEALTGAGSVPGSWGSDCLSERRSGRNAKFYTFSLDSQASVRIDLESSVDTYLYLRRGLNQRSGGYLVLNDDGGTGRNSRIARTLAAGDYTIEATTFASGRTGSFTLTVAGIPAQTPATPEVSVTAGSGVTEGGDASFTVAASPVPSGPLSVDLTVAQVGDFGVSVGSRTVSVPTTGTATLTVSTSDDDVDETDGSVSVTVGAGSGYMVSATQGSASVVVSDDDGPLPVVSVTAGSGVTEGGDASFTVTAAPAPSASLSVDVTVAQVGDFGVSTGSQTVTVPTTGSATLTVATSDDDVDETDGSVSVTVSAGSGYTVSATQGSASVVVSDDDDPPVLGCGDTDALGLEARGNHDALPNTFANRKERNDWWRAWIALSGVTGTFNTPLTAAEARVLESGDSRWTRFRAALECLEGVPVVSVTGGSGVTEGGDAVFTVTATPAPSASLSVDVTVSQAGDFGVTTGARTVTVPTTGSATVTLATSDDSADEPNGSVSVAVSSGSGYSVSATQGSASVDVADNDDPPLVTPEVSISAGSGITEGGDASFTVSASPAPSSPLSVSVTVSQVGDFGATTGSRTVTVPTSGSATVTVGTTDDGVDETNGSVRVTINGGAGYTVSANSASASVSVADNDDPPVTSDGCVEALSGSGSVQGRWQSNCGSQARTLRYARFFTFSLSSEAAVRIDLESSLDTYLYLRRGLDQRSSGIVTADDDDGPGLNSRISRTLGAGVYTIEATTYGARRSGLFTLSVSGIPDQGQVQTLPVVSVTGGGGVTEGGDASFTVSASPAPSSALSVSVTVSQSGDFGASTGSRTVTVPTSGTATFTVGTTDDNTDETDGSVSVAVNSGSGYTVSGSQGSASVSVADNDVPPPSTPEVSVTAGSGITEGGNASFTVSASPAPLAPLSVSVTVTQSGDFGASTGSRTVIVPTSGTATFTVDTTDDNTDENDGSVTVTVDALSGYTVSATQGSASVSVADNDVPPPSTPEISIVAGSGITEGGNASFTVSASPAPLAPLSVSVTVTQSGDFGASTGSRTVTVPTSGTATLTVGTTDDNTDENDGSVTVTVDALSGYTVSSSQGSASVSVADNDVPPPSTPEISITAGSGITEGGNASFTVTATPAPSAPLSVRVTVTQSGNFGASTGARTVTVPISGTASVTVGTTDDNTDEVDGSVTVTVNARSGYTVSSTQGSASVNVADNDDPPPTDLPEVSISDDTVVEGEPPYFLEFTVTLSQRSEQNVTVTYETREVTATDHLDYQGTRNGRVVIWSGRLRATLIVHIRDDVRREAHEETFNVVLTAADGATITNSTATGTIIDDE